VSRCRIRAPERERGGARPIDQGQRAVGAEATSAKRVSGATGRPFWTNADADAAVTLGEPARLLRSAAARQHQRMPSSTRVRRAQDLLDRCDGGILRRHDASCRHTDDIKVYFFSSPSTCFSDAAAIVTMTESSAVVYGFLSGERSHPIRRTARKRQLCAKAGFMWLDELDYSQFSSTFPSGCRSNLEIPFQAPDNRPACVNCCGFVTLQSTRRTSYWRSDFRPSIRMM